MRPRNRDKRNSHKHNNVNRETMESSYYLPCKKHGLAATSAGICAQCLNDRLVSLVCSDCGEQRLSSCSCSSEISARRNSCAAAVENFSRHDAAAAAVSSSASASYSAAAMLRRSNSVSTEAKRSEKKASTHNNGNSKNGFWRLGKLFGKKKEKCAEFDCDDRDDDFEGYGRRNAVVSRSLSMSNYRGGFDDVPRSRSSVSGPRVSESGRRSGFSEACVSEMNSNVNVNINNRRVFNLKEIDFSGGGGGGGGGGFEESGFIDFKFEYLSGLGPESESGFGNFGSMSMRGAENYGGGSGNSGFWGGNSGLTRGGSCRVTRGNDSNNNNNNNKEVRSGRKSLNKGWKWMFKNNDYNSGGGDL